MTSKPLPKLTTTSFALLGLLQRRPWSAYELTRFMRNSILRAVWPRAESHLYSEPKLLERRGYAASSERCTGARKSTVYTITESGREALVAWLQEERKSEFRFEYELLVRLAFTEAVAPDWALKYLQQARAEAYSDAREALAGLDAVMQEPLPMPERLGAAYTGAIINLLIEQLEARLHWVEHMEQRFLGPEPDPAQAEQLYGEARTRLLDLLREN